MSREISQLYIHDTNTNPEDLITLHEEDNNILFFVTRSDQQPNCHHVHYINKAGLLCKGDIITTPNAPCLTDNFFSSMIFSTICQIAGMNRISLSKDDLADILLNNQAIINNSPTLVGSPIEEPGAPTLSNFRNHFFSPQKSEGDLSRQNDTLLASDFSLR